MERNAPLKNRPRSEAHKDLFDERIRNTFFPGKFSAPRVDAAFHIFRSKAIRALVAPLRRNPKAILIEARAGQGKSTLAAQFLGHIKANYTWCQIGPEDRDPIVFMSALFAALLKAFPGLAGSSLYTMICKGELVGEAADQLAVDLMADLKPHLREAFYMVLDDLHFLQGAATSLAFLNTLVAQALPAMRFILISRMSIGIKCAQAVQLDNESLALTPKDVAELFGTIFKVSLPLETVAELHRASEGWVMGLILTGNAVAEKIQQNPKASIAPLIGRQPDQAWTYFQDEILNTFTPSRRRALLRLALLENIPMGLAQVVVSASEPSTFLKSLVQRNCFLRRLDESPPCYCFHHLFQEFLRQRAEEELSTRERRMVLAKAGQWFLRHHHHERALLYYLKAKTYGMAEKLLSQIGTHLLATNRTDTFKETMAQIPPEAVRSYAWLSCFIAGVYMRREPNRCLDYLEQARLRFVANGDDLGELIATTTLIIFHSGIDCRFRQGIELLPRAEALYHSLSDRLTVAARIQSGYAISYGLCYFSGQMRRAAQYVDDCYRLAEAHGLEDAVASTAVSRGLVRGLEGDWSAYKQDVEQAQVLLRSPRVGAIAKMGILLQESYMLAMEADPETYGHCRDMMMHRAPPDLMANTIFGPLLLIADIHSALAQGRLDASLAAAKMCLASGGSSQSAHIQSQFRAYHAYLSALGGQGEAALASARESSRLREEVGGAFHEVLNDLMLGGAYLYLGANDTAEPMLSRAISGAERLGTQYLKASAHAHRACLRLRQADIAGALADIRGCLMVMQGASYARFYMFHPALAHEVLGAAIKHGVEAGFAQKIAQEQLGLWISPEGEEVPILEIVTLGGLELRIRSETRIRHSDLTVSQRELLALLISAPQNSVSHEVIQEAFWPESSPAKIRSKLDNLLARLRKVFNQYLAPYPAGNYLVMERGFARLQNCRVDAHRFECEIRQANTHIRKREMRQADLAFFRGHHLFHGLFMPGVHLMEPASLYSEHLQNIFRESVCQWARLLTDTERHAEAMRLCQKALPYDPIHQPMVKTLYELMTRNKDLVQAKQLLADYQKALAREGFPARDIEQIMDDFWRSP